MLLHLHVATEKQKASVETDTPRIPADLVGNHLPICHKYWLGIQYPYTNKCSKENVVNDEKYLAALRSYWKTHNVFPTIELLCGVIGLSSKSGVFAVVGRLTQAGFLQRVDSRIAPRKKFFARPLLGPVRAGLPQPVTQEEPELITLDDHLIDEPNRTSFHRIKGDLLAVEHNSPTKPGDVVVAFADGDLTVKTLRLDGEGKFYLEAANSAYASIYPKNSLEILGVVVSVVRRLRR